MPSLLKINQLDIFLQLRLPKYGMAFLAGGILAIAGYLSQLLLNNPLADPYVLGISGGAGVSVNLALFLGLPMFLGTIFMPYFYALFGASIVAFLLFFKLKKLISNMSGVLLIGLAINFFASACISMLVYLANDNSMIRDISFWFMGSYNKVSLMDLSVVASISFLLLILVQLKHKSIYKLHLGNRRMEELGMQTKNIIYMCVALVVILTTLVLASCGPIGFIGLLVPHLVRYFQFSAKWLFPICFLVGACFTLLAELLSSYLFRQSLPPGVITAMFGIPVFLYLLIKKYRFHL